MHGQRGNLVNRKLYETDVSIKSVKRSVYFQTRICLFDNQTVISHFCEQNSVNGTSMKIRSFELRISTNTIDILYTFTFYTVRVLEIRAFLNASLNVRSSSTIPCDTSAGCTFGNTSSHENQQPASKISVNESIKQRLLESALLPFRFIVIDLIDFPIK